MTICTADYHNLKTKVFCRSSSVISARSQVTSKGGSWSSSFWHDLRIILEKQKQSFDSTVAIAVVVLETRHCSTLMQNIKMGWFRMHINCNPCDKKQNFWEKVFIYYYRIYLIAYVKKADYINILIMSIVISLIVKSCE